MEMELLRVSEVAAMMGLSRQSVYGLIAKQRLGPLIKIGRSSRIRTRDVRAWIDERAREAEGEGVA